MATTTGIATNIEMSERNNSPRSRSSKVVSRHVADKPMPSTVRKMLATTASLISSKDVMLYRRK